MRVVIVTRRGGKCHVWVPVLEQPVAGYSEDDKTGGWTWSATTPNRDESGVRDYILTLLRCW